MATATYIILTTLLCLLSSLLSTQAINIQHLLNDEKVKCESGTDDMACLKERAMRFVDTVMSKDNYKIGDVEVNANGYKKVAETEAETARSEKADFLNVIEQYIQGHDVTMDLPMADAKVTLSSRNLSANDEFNVSVKFANDELEEGRRKKGGLFKKVKKHRLRKMALPLMVLILLKAITIIPMAIGILKIKALNALGLGFLSFVISVGLAIFQLCKKIATEHHTSHGHWAERALPSNTASLVDLYEPSSIATAQHMAYNAYA